MSTSLPFMSERASIIRLAVFFFPWLFSMYERVASVSLFPRYQRISSVPMPLLSISEATVLRISWAMHVCTEHGYSYRPHFEFPIFTFNTTFHPVDMYFSGFPDNFRPFQRYSLSNPKSKLE